MNELNKRLNELYASKREATGSALIADTQKKGGTFAASAPRILMTMIIAIAMTVMVACHPSMSTEETVMTVNKAIDNTAIRKVAQEFMGNHPFPRSFLGNTGHISNPYQKLIAEEGVIIYDMAILLKALLLNPKENEDLIGRIINMLYGDLALRSNRDFYYNDVNIPIGYGYYYKILNIIGTVLKDQYQPITGESAHIASALAWAYSARNEFTRNDLGGKAYKIMHELGKAMLALQIPQGSVGEGLIVMAPREPSGYSYMGVNFNKTVSVESSISAYNALNLLVEHCKNEKDKQEYAAALVNLEKGLIGMYNSPGEYFNTGLDIYRNILNISFATDCQTWMILGMGADWLNTLMGNENFSLKLLKRTLQVSGVKNDKGEYIGLDFHNRLGAGGSVVSFEWTFGFVIAAQRVLLLNPDAEIQNAVNTIREYAKSQELPGNLYKYTDSDKMVSTGFGWDDLGMISLASSSWALFLDLGIDPFSLITEIGENTITFAEGEMLSVKAATEVAAKQSQTAKPQIAKPQTAKPVSYKVIHKGEPVYLSNNKSFALNLFPALEGERLYAGTVIRLKYDAESPYSKNDPGAPNLLLGLVYSTEVILFTNKRNIAKDPKIILMTRDAANNGWMATLPKTIPNELVQSVAVDFGNKTIFSNWNLNINYSNPQFTEIEILKGSAK